MPLEDCSLICVVAKLVQSSGSGGVKSGQITSTHIDIATPRVRLQALPASFFVAAVGGLAGAPMRVAVSSGAASMGVVGCWSSQFLRAPAFAAMGS